MSAVTELGKVAQRGRTEVALVGELHVDEAMSDPELGYSAIAVLRTDVGFLYEKPSPNSTSKDTVFEVACHRVRAGTGLCLRTADGSVALDPNAIRLEQTSQSTKRCYTTPPGFEEADDSPHAWKGPMGRRDHALLPGDRVEFLGRVERVPDGFRSVGEFELRDLSLGQPTLAAEQASTRRLVAMLVVGLLVVVGIVLTAAILNRG